MQQIDRILDFCRFYQGAQTLHDVHSPRLFAQIEAILDRENNHPDFNKIERLRFNLLEDNTIFSKPNIGAPSQMNPGKTETTISHEAEGSPISASQGRWLYRLVAHLKPKAMLELGTSFGIGTLYQHLGSPTAKLLSMEGNPEVARRAQQHLKDWPGAGSVEIQEALFDGGIENLKDSYDYFFIDGDHRRESLLRYVQKLQQHAKPSATFVLHDIHWSQGMYKAWKELRQMSFVTASIDLYHLGILLTDPSFDSAHHLEIVPSRWKPWRLGIWGRNIR